MVVVAQNSHKRGQNYIYYKTTYHPVSIAYNKKSQRQGALGIYHPAINGRLIACTVRALARTHAHSHTHTHTHTHTYIYIYISLDSDHYHPSHPLLRQRMGTRRFSFCSKSKTMRILSEDKVRFSHTWLCLKAT